jgi:hypothetical protein
LFLIRLKERFFGVLVALLGLLMGQKYTFNFKLKVLYSSSADCFKIKALQTEVCKAFDEKY